MSSTNDFLDNDYEVPSSGGNYMKIAQGDNRFRILSKPVLGWVGWDDNKKVFRYPFKQKPSTWNGKDPLRHFWAMIVYNNDAKSIQVLELTAGPVQSRIKEISKDADWGAPYEYDIKVNRTGEKLQTKYAVTPCPKSKVSDEIHKMALEKPIYLDNLFGENGDPFKENGKKQTELIINDLPF